MQSKTSLSLSFVNNVLDDVAVLQVLRDGDAEIFHQSAGAPSPRL